MKNSNAETTTSGELTFGVEKLKTVIVEDASGTQTVAYHDNDTWWEGHANVGTKIQLDHPPVKLVKN